MNLKVLFCLLVTVMEIRLMVEGSEMVKKARTRQGGERGVESQLLSTLVKERCKRLKYNLKSGSKLSNVAKTCDMIQCPVYVSEHRKFMYCNVPKVASTTLKSEMTRNLGLSPRHIHNGQGIEMLRVSPLTFDAETRSKYLKYMFVRHPFARLVSFYTNKKETALPKFMNLLNETEPGEISFRKFVDRLIQTKVSKYGRHFMPYTRMCLPCQVNYDFVGKMEYLDRDRTALYNRIGFGPPSDIQLNSRNSSLNVAKLFSQLTKDQVRKLYDKYFYDFEIFGYSREPYFTYTTS